MKWYTKTSRIILALHKSLHAMRVLTTTFTVPFPVASGGGGGDFSKLN